MGANLWFLQAKNAEITRSEQESTQALARMDAQLKEIEAQKEAERAAALKEQQEAAAAKAAEQAKNADASNANTIDSRACNTATSHTNPASIDVMVNKKHCIQPLSYAPADLVTSHGATLSKKAMSAFNKMYDAAAAAGQPFYVTSSYRSYATQISTYNYWISISGQAGADTYSARPGYSEHQTGLAFDVAASGCTLDCFGSTSQYKWFQQHAAEYGFIQRYYAGYESITGYKAEEWHYRYVGIEAAQDMKAKGIKTLEQYWNMPGGVY